MSKLSLKSSDDYFNEKFLGNTTDLPRILKQNTNAGLPPIHVSPLQGKFLYLIAKSIKAKRILEIGTLGGYSTIWLARALNKKGKLITLENKPFYVQIAQENIRRSKLNNRVEVKLGSALDSLEAMKENEKPFDLVFIDADKPNYQKYIDRVLPLTKQGSVIICDNVVRKGEISNPNSSDHNIIGLRKFIDKLASISELNTTVIQTIDQKGYDGFTFSVVTANFSQNK